MLRRFLGLIILLSTIVVLVVLVASAYYFGVVLDNVAVRTDNGLILAVETLEVVSSTLEQTQSTLVEVNDSLDTASITTASLSRTVADTVPLLEQIAVVVSDQLPENVEGVQAAIPNISAVAGVVDDALRRLSSFGIQQTIPIPFNPIEIDFDLGIDYDPDEPFDQTMDELGTSLEGLPEELRLLRGELEVSAVNLVTLSSNLDDASGDIQAINQELAQFIPLLDQYLDLLERVIAGIEEVRSTIAANLANIRLVGTILPLALAITQLAPLVVGWDLLTGRNEPAKREIRNEDALAKYSTRMTESREIKGPADQTSQADSGTTRVEDEDREAGH